MSGWPVNPAEVVLGDLSDDRRAEAQELLRVDPAFRAEVERLRRPAVLLEQLGEDAWELGPAPALDLPKLVAGRGRPAATEPAPAAARADDPRWSTAPGRRWRGRTLVLRPVTAGLAVLGLLALGGGVGAALRGGETPAATASPPWRVALAPLPGQPASERARVALPAGVGGPAEVVARGLPPTPPGHFYEMWFMDDARRLVSVGTFVVGPTGRVHARFTTGADPRRYRYVDVSLERDDGRPGHSGRSVLRSRTLS